MYIFLRWFYLAIDVVDGGSRWIEGEEQVISAPLDQVPYMVILPNCLVLLAILYNWPAEQCHWEGHGEVELDVVAGIVVPADEPALHVGQVGPVLQAWVPPPGDPVVFRELPGWGKQIEEKYRTEESDTSHKNLSERKKYFDFLNFSGQIDVS